METLAIRVARDKSGLRGKGRSFPRNFIRALSLASAFNNNRDDIAAASLESYLRNVECGALLRGNEKLARTATL